MIVADLSPRDLAGRLANSGLRLRTGPVVNRIQTRLGKVVQGIALHYADYTIEDSDGFADFSVRVVPPRNTRRWLKAQVSFRFDAASPFLPLPAAQAFAMLEWGLNWCVSNHCHQYLIVHSAAVERAGCALLLPGPPGSGKSTLCAALISRGWRLLADELTLLDLATGSVVPLPRPVSLKNQSIAVIARFAPEAQLGPPVHDTVKGSVAHMKAPADSVLRSRQPASPRWVVLPRYAPEAAGRLVPLSKARTFMHLADQAFNYEVHGRRGFELLAQLITNSDCFEYQYSALEAAVAAFDAMAHRP